MNSRLRNTLQYIFFAGLGIFLVWWSIKDLNSDDRSHIRTALQNARYVLIVPVFTILLLSHFFRALRWNLLIKPLGYTPGKRNAFFAVMIGYLVNQAGLRLGEVVKCTVLGKYEKVPVDKLIGTILLERLIDAITLLVVFVITFLIQPGLYNDLYDTFFRSSTGDEKEGIPFWVIALIILAVIVLAAGIWMFLKKKKPYHLWELIGRIWNSIWKGVGTIRHLEQGWLFIFYTIMIWSLYFVGGYIGFYALSETEHYGVKEAFSVLSAGSIGMIATPGGIGAYAVLVEATMQLYGLQKGVALAFGWLLWFAQTAVILLGGLVSFALLPYYNRKKNESNRQDNGKDIHD